MTMSAGPQGTQSRQGTYTLSGDSITISIENETKSGTLTFEGNDRATISMDEMKMTLSRTSG